LFLIFFINSTAITKMTNKEIKPYLMKDVNFLPILPSEELIDIHSRNIFYITEYSDTDLLDLYC